RHTADRSPAHRNHDDRRNEPSLSDRGDGIESWDDRRATRERTGGLRPGGKSTRYRVLITPNTATPARPCCKRRHFGPTKLDCGSGLSGAKTIASCVWNTTEYSSPSVLEILLPRDEGRSPHDCGEQHERPLVEELSGGNDEVIQQVPQ